VLLRYSVNLRRNKRVTFAFKYEIKPRICHPEEDEAVGRGVPAGGVAIVKHKCNSPKSWVVHVEPNRQGLGIHAHGYATLVKSLYAAGCAMLPSDFF
jgi:hypothetical protein